MKICLAYHFNNKMMEKMDESNDMPVVTTEEHLTFLGKVVEAEVNKLTIIFILIIILFTFKIKFSQIQSVARYKLKMFYNFFSFLT